MKAGFPASLALVVLGTTLAAPTPLTLKASDGVTVSAQSASVPNPKGVILLFHQARSNMHEYDPIMQKLALQGYATLAIDQRAGGQMFGAENQTAKAVPSADYADALPDLEAAVAWAKQKYQGMKIYALGSSYSAMLLFPLAERHRNWPRSWPSVQGITAVTASP